MTLLGPYKRGQYIKHVGRVRFLVEKSISPEIQDYLSVCSFLDVTTKDSLVLPVLLSGTDWLNHI